MKQLILTACLFAISSISQAWTTYQGNPSHTGYIPIEVDTNNFTLKWETTLSPGLNPVTTGAGKVYVTSSEYFANQNIFTLDAETGSTIWEFNFGNVYSTNPPAYNDNKVYVQTGNHSSDTYLRAFDVNTGELVFQSAHAAQWERYLAPTIVDNVAYINGGSYGGMYAFDAQNGQQLWFTGLPQYADWTPAIDDSYAYAYTGGTFSKLNKATGAIVSQTTDTNYVWTGYSMNLAPVLGGADDAFVINGGRLIRFTLSNATINYEIAGNFTGQPSLSRGVLYTISSNALSARDQQTGALLWSWIPSGGETLTSPMVIMDSHIIVSGSTNTYAVNITTHNDEWSYAATGQLAVADSVLYISNKSTGLLSAFNMGPPPDQDQDGIADGSDNCPAIFNPTQADIDNDGVGDSCNEAIDADGDKWADSLDNCPAISNTDQANSDGDEFGDVCDPYPAQADNLGTCLTTVASNETLITQLHQENETLSFLNQKLTAQLVDSDNDGLINTYDTCENSTGEIDQTGCTLVQYCNNQVKESACRYADWKNDENRSPRDCRWSSESNMCNAR